MAKYIFVTGGVSSSLGKGIIAASLAKLLQARGYTVTIQKFDPYINVDPGTLNPYEHGECFVTDDGAETDLDLGHYERFLNIPTSQANNVTTGRIYQTVINKEREGAFLGKTVQIIPHITDEIKRRMMLISENNEYDIIITEIGGTVGDIESLPYIETIRQLKWDLGRKNCLTVHLTLVPFLSAASELKTKPTQHSVKELLSAGVQPDILVCRTEHALTQSIKNKLSLFCNLSPECVIEAMDANSIYDVPVLMQEEKLDTTVLSILELPEGNVPDMKKWNAFLDTMKHSERIVNIGLIGKYVELQDAYKSILEAFVHAGVANACKVKVISIASEDINADNVKDKIAHLDGILVAPGFGERGIEGKIEAIKFARENDLPFFGICLGMQCAVVEYARNILGIKDAASSEMDEQTRNPVIDLMEAQKGINNKGGTMRLGSYPCNLVPNSKAIGIYGQKMIQERHRHRYELNNQYRDQLQAAGLNMSGINPETDLVEVVEIPAHKWFLGVQFHPEYKSTVENPHPLFVNFIKNCIS